MLSVQPVCTACVHGLSDSSRTCSTWRWVRARARGRRRVGGRAGGSARRRVGGDSLRRWRGGCDRCQSRRSDVGLGQTRLCSSTACLRNLPSPIGQLLLRQPQVLAGCVHNDRPVALSTCCRPGNSLIGAPKWDFHRSAVQQPMMITVAPRLHRSAASLAPLKVRARARGAH